MKRPDAGSVRMVGNLLGDYQHEVKIGDEVEVARGDREDAPLAQWRRPVK